jgi:peptidoglycan/xylan/chitin deacetylase (PgdA/CDA1 family)
MPTATASTGTTAPPLSPSSRPAVTSPPTPLTQSTAPVPVGSSPASPTIAPTPTAQVVAGFAGKDIVRLPTTTRVVALTFDAGANANAIPEILATLRSENVPATFFLTGDWVRHFPAQARDVGALFPVGNHSNTHPHLPQLSSAQVASQITDAQASISAATGRDTRPLFRFPFGNRDARTMAVVNGLGYVSVFWTVDTLGWEGTSGGQTTSTVTAHVLAQLQPGEIVLMHVGSNPKDRSTLDGDALRGIIEAMKAAGYGFVTIPQGLGLA